MANAYFHDGRTVRNIGMPGADEVIVADMERPGAGRGQDVVDYDKTGRSSGLAGARMTQGSIVHD